MCCTCIGNGASHSIVPFRNIAFYISLPVIGIIKLRPCAIRKRCIKGKLLLGFLVTKNQGTAVINGHFDANPGISLGDSKTIAANFASDRAYPHGIFRLAGRQQNGVKRRALRSRGNSMGISIGIHGHIRGCGTIGAGVKVGRSESCCVFGSDVGNIGGIHVRDGTIRLICTFFLHGFISPALMADWLEGTSNSEKAPLKKGTRLRCPRGTQCRDSLYA